MKRPPKTENELGAFLRKTTVGGRMSNKSDLLKVYHELAKRGKIKKSEALERLLTKRAVRTLSGVAIVTVLTKPFPCPGRCLYCPDEKKMPKSYLSDEPAAARALLLNFDPYEQVARRIEALEKNGHPTDKIELIVKGGTWNAYPADYQYWFIRRCYEAANARFVILNEATCLPAGRKRSEESFLCHSAAPRWGPFGKSGNPSRLDPRLRGDDKKMLAYLIAALSKAQKKNETAKHRVIGLTLETRPDCVNEKNIQIMRELGATRIELGVQTIDDKILKLVRRGHNAAETVRATKLLKNYGFKVDYHLMPQLPGATTASDLKNLLAIFKNPDYRPDMLKIYPCVAVKNSPLSRLYKAGKYKPYSVRQLIEVIKKFKTKIPYYVRVSRLIRDIPSHHIVAGNKITNLRQTIQAEMAAEGKKCRCLRCREIGHATQAVADLSFPRRRESIRPKLFIEKYQASGGTEYFLSYEDPRRQVVFAFCRLRLCHCEEAADRRSNPIAKTAGLLRHSVPRNDTAYPAFLRELHTYGQLASIKQNNNKTNKQKGKKIQHTGLGKKLLAEVEKICKKNKIPKLAVISGVGVREYYRKSGYKLENGYMVKNF